jgi:hypothetical protein
MQLLRHAIVSPHVMRQRRWFTSVSPTGKTPVNTIKPVDPHKVAAWGVESIVLDLPRRNDTEKWYDESKEVYLKARRLLGDEFEGMWLVASAETSQYHIFPNEELAQMARKVLGLRTAYVDCLGREILELVENDDQEELDSDDDATQNPLSISYPPFSNKGYHLWRSAFWLPASWSTLMVSPAQVFMKLDTGAASVGAPSAVFTAGLFTPGKEKMHRGIGGQTKRRHAEDIVIQHAGYSVKCSVFEYNKWLLGYPWIKHYAINLNVNSSPPFSCTPISKE